MKNILLVIVLFLSGCMTADLTSTGNLFENPEGPSENASIIFFFTKQTVGGNVCILVGVDGERQGCLGYPGFLKVGVTPGEKEISFTPNALIKIANAKFVYNFLPGRIYYIEHIVLRNDVKKELILQENFNMLTLANYAWVLRNENDALSKLSNLREWR